MSRPQVSIERLPQRRASNEVRESMNCKSCRKRKIKCSRTRPTCESCALFQCACIYDAVPKKRGPKTDVLEALLKRVDGLEKRLQEEQQKTENVKKTSLSPSTPSPSAAAKRKSDAIEDADTQEQRKHQGNSPQSHGLQPENQRPYLRKHSAPSLPAPLTQAFSNTVPARMSATTPPPVNQFVMLPDSVLDAFFARVNECPFYFLDEQRTRESHRAGQLSPVVSMAVYSITMRYSGWPGASSSSLRRLSQSYALKARQAIDFDTPALESLQALLILSLAFFANGQGRKSYLSFGNCISMVYALDLHCEVPQRTKMLPSEREMRRRVFWTCYLLDRFFSCGSKRPALIPDSYISLRLPSWSSITGGMPIQDGFFHTGPNIHYPSDSRRDGQDAVSLLIDITRILGVANQYLAGGGVKSDTHFPWHSHSSVSKIRHDLDVWASSTQNLLGSVETIFGHPQSSTLSLSKLIYHLVHCMIYRPFLPINLVELRGSGQHQSWQVEATNLCFSHANAIIELVEIGRFSGSADWTSFVGYCVWTAGTVHIHGAHYKGEEGEAFSSSADYLMRGISQLSWLSNTWAGIQHHRDMLQNIYAAHTELVSSLMRNPLSTPVAVFHLDGFFERYIEREFDGSHVRLIDMPIEEFVDGLAPFSRNAQELCLGNGRSLSISSAAPKLQQHSTDSQVPGAFNVLQSAQARSAQVFPQPQPSQYYIQTPNLPPRLSIPATSAATSSDAPYSSVSDITQNTSNIFNSIPTNFAFQSQLSNQPYSAPPATQYATYPFEQRQTSQPNQFPSHDAYPQQVPLLVQSAIDTYTPSTDSQMSPAAAADQAASPEKDPFLSLLEQLADEQTPIGGPNELNFFLPEEHTSDYDKANQSSPHVAFDVGSGLATNPRDTNGNASVAKEPAKESENQNVPAEH